MSERSERTITWAIVVAAGRGERFGRPKQYELIAGKRVLDWSVDDAMAACDGVVVVVPQGDVGVQGGATRSESVRNGLAVVPDDADVIVVHDAARPAAGVALFRAVIDAVRAGADGAIPGIPVTDTVKRVEGSTVVETLDRTTLVAVQTPQAFTAAALRGAHVSGEDATDDAALVERAGGRVVVVPGHLDNRKLTQLSDVAVLEAVLVTEQGEHRSHQIRVGQGFDVHPYADDDDTPLVLGGVTFEGTGLAGHSDGDVIAHAVADALLGAAGLGDIGMHFPDTDPRWRGADSIVLLEHVAGLLGQAGWTPVNVDCSVVLDAPKLAPKREEIEGRLSGAVGAEVTVKGKRPEGLGALGRGEGIACWAVALVERG